MKNSHFVAFFAAIFALVATPAAAQQNAIELSGDVMVVKTVTEEGSEPRTELVEPSTVVPGDRLRFRTGYKNVSSEPVENFVITKPINSALRLIAGEYEGAQASVDGGAVFGDLSTLTVSAEDGTIRPARESDITHLRWTLPRIAAGASGDVIYHAIVR